MINARVSAWVGNELFTVQVAGDGSDDRDWVALDVIHYEQDAWAVGALDPEDPHGGAAAVVYVRRGSDKAWGVYQGEESLGESESLRQAMTLAVTLVTAPWQEG